MSRYKGPGNNYKGVKSNRGFFMLIVGLDT
jgi:hypothetical protein